MGEGLVQSLIITVTGMIVVFMVLAVLSLSFSAMAFLSRDKKGVAKGKPPIAADDTDASEDANLYPPDIERKVTDEDELAAVITAALASYMAEGRIVSSIRRVEDTTAWSRIGRHEQMLSRLS